MAGTRGFDADALGLHEAPWDRVLSGFEPPWYVDRRDLSLLEGEECILWLGVKGRMGFPAIPDDLDHVCEVLHLLTLLARVNFDAWIDEMFKIWPKYESWRGWVEFELKPVALQRPLRVGLLLGARDDEDVKRLRVLGRSNTSKLQSKEYLESRELLLQEDPSLGERGEKHWEVPVCIEHEYLRANSKVVAEMMDSTLAVAEMVQHTYRYDLDQECEERHTLLKPRFIVDEVRSMVYRNGIVTTESLHSLAQLVKLGVRVGNMSIHSVATPLWQVHVELKELVEALRCITVQDQDIAQVKSGIRSVRVGHEHSREAMLELLSAVSTSECVRDVEIDLYEEEDSDDEEWPDDDEDRGRDWEWVTYHLFSRFASHNIHSLGMNLRRLKPGEVDAVRGLLNDKNPLARLDGRHDELDGVEPHQLVASRFCVTFPAQALTRGVVVSNKSDEHMFTTPKPIAVRVIYEPVEGEGPWWLVVLPGLNFAWVHEEDIQSFVHPTQPDQVASRPAFPTIRITELSDEARESSLDLLRLIGHGTQRIELLEDFSYSLDGWCGPLLQACPQLVDLLLECGAVESLDVFVAAAEAGNCRLRFLKLPRVLTTDSKHIRHFFNVLCDPRHPLTTHLRRLHLTFLIEHDTIDEIVDAAVRLLQRNRQLLHVHLGIYLTEGFASRKDDIKQAFEPQLQTPAMIRVAPLQVDSKLAFLSVVDNKLAEGNAWTHLDSGVLSKVFEFAAVACVRRFDLNISS